ncbi:MULTISPECIES: non-homologous end-joining DNA ligase [unclassified Gordonia (in: high G+C Gram-positive bacteria)]|uniref:non-homologous end-joining DNA ligase n=1 Tax=unclassified Gordonia (in: high G+C Gram-positive bacteria) TaxID=2657482 RepID=UPI001FFE9316|nr:MULTISPECIES: non-homologous end-joining DNA ligase [unclassified Gordonia (in: high G+C Gram-positive bacteria)]UQE73990.1 non-homologous end-joining DNA ligase [Gordonia sp. PP30]
MSDSAVELVVPGSARTGAPERTVRLSSPDRVYFPEAGLTKLDLARYYLSVGDGIERALHARPTMLHRFPKGLAGPKVHQKKLPAGAPDWIETVPIFFPRYSRIVDELCPAELAPIIWAVQMSTVEFHPWNSRRADVERPDEWRIDLDPMPDCDFARVRRVAHAAHELLDELGIRGFPKTSGGHGLHIYVRIEPEWEFGDVRRAALAFGRELTRRLPGDATVTWWRKDRDPSQVFVDFNQNARDHTMAAAYSVRATGRATVSTPIEWDELDSAEPDDFTVATVPERFARIGDLFAPIDDVSYRLDILLEWADRDSRDDEGGGISG